jgi:trans-aconitate methyltransferase
VSALDDIYDAAWVAHDFAELQPEFDVVADAIYRQFKPERVVDVGCGPGMILHRLWARDVEVSGLEGSRHCRAYAHENIREFIKKANIVSHPDIVFCDLVICTEVAEHLDEKDAPTLVRLLCSAMCPIVFTAAPPGQDGHHHVNCQPPEYWITMFEDRGAFHDVVATEELQARWGGLQRLSHMTRNVMVFT